MPFSADELGSPASAGVFALNGVVAAQINFASGALFLDCRQKFRKRGAVFGLTMLPPMHAVVEVDDIKFYAAEHQFNHWKTSPNTSARWLEA